jgi:CheY-like chemotaxis protein
MLMGADDPLSQFEARLLALKHKMESGLVDRARALREMAVRVEAGDAKARKEIKTESHKLRGVAGSYGHQDLTELAGQLEQRASLSPPAMVSQLARDLADLAEQRGRKSQPPPPMPAIDAQPANPRPPSNRPRKLQQKSAGLGKGMSVLAMDDDPVTRRLLLLTLEQVGGFETKIVGSAAEALALLATRSFHIVVSDAMMPDMNGRQFRRQAREQGATMPIVILSAASPDELGWSAESGTNDSWLRKPFKPTELVRDLIRIIGKR